MLYRDKVEDDRRFGLYNTLVDCDVLQKKIFVIDQVKHILGDGLREIVIKDFCRAGDLMVWGYGSL